jgi:hypothetical protein
MLNMYVGALQVNCSREDCFAELPVRFHISRSEIDTLSAQPMLACSVLIYKRTRQASLPARHSRPPASGAEK